LQRSAIWSRTARRRSTGWARGCSTSAPHLQKLSDDVGYTVNMAVLDGTDIV
jgi:DNA-binding IclR family transcriptional regulator